MKPSIERALASASDTRALEIGQDILDRVPQLFSSQFEGKKAVVVCDLTTYEVAGKKVQEYLENAGLAYGEPFVYNEARPYAEFGNVELLENALKKHDAIPVAVGSGTLNDMTKLAASRTNRQYMCVATAASVDGYTAFGASITFEGAKQTFSCPAPQVVLADIEVIRKAPAEMTAAGYADLFAKVTAGADWIISDALGVEAIDPTAWSIVQDELKEALSDPKGAREGNVEAITRLTEGLMLCGFAMQWSKTSRPASGAEHQFSHLWNMEHHVHNGETPSHGFQVGIATLAVTRLYEYLLEFPVDQIDVTACVNDWPEWPEMQKRAEEKFSGTDYLDTAVNQTKAKHLSKEEMKAHIEKLKAVWPKLKQDLQKQLISSKELEQCLIAVGAPVDSMQIGITPEHLRESYVRAQFLRSRFTALDLALRIGQLSPFLNKMFS
ncbi:sn-glycerol-1-phosphate dehydrogenase [Maribellus sp. YY47]|uniref:sn-glycerol-1-phosphate dehydrogenase n=1 Tax=Maribellus sp. YY47 TaxID=2929486 RepID=UPI002000C829|nr:sn-glycerol-1-phosphate dehydrogenase [Maribellus sp. YY47]MCK3684732.1 iron-containing alcohol dehydrogenase [Maribellus sp. YY47]